jgi:endo-1,4-beta-D-glucanase Y
MAVEKGERVKLKEIWDLAKDNLTREEINKLLLATNNGENTVWHKSVYMGRRTAMKEIWDLVKNNLTT